MGNCAKPQAWGKTPPRNLLICNLKSPIIAPLPPLHDHNRRAWDSLVRKRQRHTRPADDAEFANPLAAVDSAGWLGPSIAGWRVLCLAAGGGRQSALFAAAGAEVTVVDLSPEMLALDRQVAAERNLEIRTVETSM